MNDYNLFTLNKIMEVYQKKKGKSLTTPVIQFYTNFSKVQNCV